MNQRQPIVPRPKTIAKVVIAAKAEAEATTKVWSSKFSGADFSFKSETKVSRCGLRFSSVLLKSGFFVEIIAGIRVVIIVVVVIPLSAKASAILFSQNSSLMHVGGASLKQNTYYKFIKLSNFSILFWKLRLIKSFQLTRAFWMFDKIDPLSFLRSQCSQLLLGFSNIAKLLPDLC